ncbi:hypothetical protein EHS25_002843 [Saitozyma podzolica]|uniref:Guanine nucleotide-binding protein alpha-2 subunit n=1 Tax=Saitozyma podzolica TaxID=1890683 RepID=A0A427YC21_9TREE|nr:hypothetical protein EHS25_002843 [Saitozyma podzolica]
MRYIHAKPFSPDEVEDYRKIVFSNLVTGMRAIIDTMDELGMAVQPNSRKYIAFVDNEPSLSTGEDFPKKYLEALRVLWADKGVQECYAKRNEYALQENLPFFFAKLDEVFAPGWQPGHEDILRVRSKTTGITETKFQIKGDVTFRLFDVGGQRSERRKWLSVFSETNAVVFITALSDYSSGIVEDLSSNGMVESLVLFESIVNSQWFVKTAIILFLNKADVLAEQIKDPNQQVKPYFQDFPGKPGSYNDALEFFKQKHLSLVRGRDAPYLHVTTAINKDNMVVVMSAVTDSIVRDQLRSMAII